jgi:hypothetical protein
MSSTIIFLTIAKLFQPIFFFYEFIQNKFNYSLIMLGFIGLFYWLNYQHKFNKSALNNPNQIK